MRFSILFVLSGHLSGLVAAEQPLSARSKGSDAAKALIPVIGPNPTSVTQNPLQSTMRAQSTKVQAPAGSTSLTPPTTHGLLPTVPAALAPTSATPIHMTLTSNTITITNNTPLPPESSSSSDSASSIYSQDSTIPPSLIPSTLSSAPATSNANIAPTVRYILIGVLAGIPAVTVLGFMITLRWRRAQRSRGYTGSSDNNLLGPAAFKRKSTRFSSFFGVIHGNVPHEKVMRKEKRHMYATSVHSTAGLAGVGAHRGGIVGGVPPMIHYVKFPESSKRVEADTKANFDNPFGTPPPVFGGFVIHPSRVSPHITQTPPLHLVQLPSEALESHNPSHQGPRAKWTNALIVEPPPKIYQNLPRRGQSAKLTDAPSSSTNVKIVPPRRAAGLQPTPQPQQKSHKSARPPTHVRVGPTTSSSNRDFLSPHPPPKVRRSHRQPPLLDLRHIAPTRASIAPSVYGGIASPRVAGVTTPTISPALPYLAPSPVAETTPVLPYLAPPSPDPRIRTRAQEQRQTLAPVIVIEAASTIDSLSEYDDDGSEEESRTVPTMGRRGVQVESVLPPRRDGLVGSPHGYVPPSTTFSTVSSYSLSSVYGIPSSISSSTYSTIPYESSTSSVPIMSASSSDDSSVTVRAVPRHVEQFRGAVTSRTRSRHGSLWLPTNFDELERGKRLMS